MLAYWETRSRLYGQMKDAYDSYGKTDRNVCRLIHCTHTVMTDETREYICCQM